jgi:hypothetical protein
MTSTARTAAAGTPGVEEIWPGAIPETGDDLGDVLGNVRVTRLAATRRAWANSWQTRAFLHLGLRLLHEHQMQGEEAAAEFGGVNLWAAVSPERLADLAQRVLRDPAHADALSVVRWKETWGHRAAFTEDLIAYLFRPAPYLRRIAAAGQDIAVTSDLDLVELVHLAAQTEYLSTTADPLVGLQTWLQAAMPTHPVVRRHVIGLEEAGLAMWAQTYERIFPAFGLFPRPGVTWRDVAELFTTLTEGLLLRARIRGEQPRLSDGSRLLGGGVLAMVSGLFDVLPADLAGRYPLEGRA